MSDFATVNDVISLWRPLTTAEQERTEALLPVISDSLRVEATKVGKDLDAMAASSEAYANVLRSVTVDIAARVIMTATEGQPVTQETQSGLGYSWTGTYLNPGGGLFIKRAELARLGLRRQRYGVIDFYGPDGNND